MIVKSSIVTPSVAAFIPMLMAGTPTPSIRTSPAPAPSMSATSLTAGRLTVGEIVPWPAASKPTWSIVGAAAPAAHSPAATPEARFEFAEVIASRSVHSPSLPS